MEPVEPSIPIKNSRIALDTKIKQKQDPLPFEHLKADKIEIIRPIYPADL